MKKIIWAFCLISISAVADDEWGAMNFWPEKGFAQAYVTHQDKSTKSFQATIDDNPAGEQVVVFRFYDSSRDKCGAPASHDLSDVVIKINGQRVKMKVGCKRMGLSEQLRYFASTKEGNAYIVGAFKKGKPVLVTMQGYNVEIPAEGFDVAWKAYGGDAI